MENSNLNQNSFHSEEKVFNTSYDSDPTTPKSEPKPIHLIYFDQKDSKCFSSISEKIIFQYFI
jgi:hypothetical protein